MSSTSLTMQRPEVVDGSGDPAGTWQSAAFRDAALGWVRDVLAARGTAVLGELTTHRVRFWSAVLTVRTDRGVYWFKATNPGQAFEGPLLECLGRLVHRHIVAPAAVDETRGWFLLPDGGPSVAADVDAARWEELVVQVARLQTELVGHGKELAALGLPSLLPGHADEYATSLVESLARLPAGHPQHLTGEEAHRLLRGLAQTAPLLAELASSGVPPTLQPNDTSPANAVRAADRSGYRFLDLGDAFWSHPFAVLQVPLRMATGSWPGPPARESRLRERLVRAYVEQWPQVTPGRNADRLVDAADRLASLHRAESWRRLLAHVDPARLGVPTPRLADWLADAARPLDRTPKRTWHSTTASTGRPR
ncbi:hypothetical protein AA0Y32_04405 [Georgenia phoenicis]|uniref:hypothetical protein n=1 Tax=unclassified Georgenia TaxID=2626815 RepID=UPI0039B0E521